MIKSVIGKTEEKVKFLYPKDKVASSLESYFLGTDTPYIAPTTDMNTTAYKAYVVNLKEVWIKKVGESTGDKILDLSEYLTLVGDNPIISEMDCCFDQNMYPYIVFKVKNKWFRYIFVNHSYSLNAMPKIVKHCKIGMDTLNVLDLPKSDVVCAYITVDNKLCYGTQRAGFSDGVVIANVESYRYIHKCGLTTDDKFAIVLR